MKNLRSHQRSMSIINYLEKSHGKSSMEKSAQSAKVELTSLVFVHAAPVENSSNFLCRKYGRNDTNHHHHHHQQQNTRTQ